MEDTYMFKVAPRYLSGVSVFYGDDITRREIDGELAVFIGQASKGPSVPVQLQSPDNAVAIYGSDNPLVKALYEFYDGYIDAGRNQNMKFVTYRIGGIPASIDTSYGLVATTTDAYDGIENDYFAYVNNTSADVVAVKFWDKNKLLVFDSTTGINTGHFTVDSLPVGDGSTIYGVDIDADPLEVPVTLAQLVNLDIITPGGAALTVAGGGIDIDDTTIVVTEDISLYPSTGTLKVSETVAAVTTVEFVRYTSFNSSTRTFTLATPTTKAFTTNGKVSLVGSTIVLGDSELDLTNRQKYEKMRNGLLDIEMFTPDYIVPGGVEFNATQQYTKTTPKTTLLKQNLTAASTYAVADAAADWPATGIINIWDGTDNNYMNYTANTVLGSDYRLELSTPIFTFSEATTEDQTSITVTGTTAAAVLSAGYIQIGTGVYHYTTAAETPLTLDLDNGVAVADAGVPSGKKVPGAFTANVTEIRTTFSELTNFVLGIGFVKETDNGGSYTFQWSDTKLAGYNIAHFGYLFANFCNDAAVGYNTPLCGMNVKVPTKFDRNSIVTWIGKLPEFRIRVDNSEAVEAVVKNGTGILGDAVMAGSVEYNRVYMSKADEGYWVDPAYGLLMTDEGFVDGHEVKDTYNKVVDLGKFLCVGGGLITFANRASSSAYIDTCGIYALGQLAGKPKNEGISFSKIGTGSNATVTVIVNRNLYNDLASLGYVVVTREKGLGWVINNSNSAARNESGYFLISTTRTIKYVIEGKRSILVTFIGKPVTRFIYEAARTRLAESFQDDVKGGLLATIPVWDLRTVESAKAIGKFELKASLNPALELTQVDVDAVIERSANI